MKNILKYIVLILMIISTTSVLEVSAETKVVNFPSIKLRHGYTYYFLDRVNAGSEHLVVNNYAGTSFTESDGESFGTDPEWGFVQSFIDKNYWVAPYTSEKAYASTAYTISKHPSVRRTNNLVIKYQMQYQLWRNNKRTAPQTHIENQPYEITWCGDGVRDVYTDYATGDRISETCDPADTSHTNWGTGGCSNACQPVVAQPVCNSLSYVTDKNPIKIGTDSLTKTVSCTATNATKIKIDCGNSSTQEFNGNKTGSKTVSKVCTYNTAGTYKPKCYVDTTISNNKCEDSLTVLNPTPKIEIIKTDYNSQDEDGHMETDSQTVRVGDKAVFKITVNNIGGEDLKDVEIKDAKEPSCNRTAAQTKALYPGNVFAKGASFSYTCERLDTQANYTNTADVFGKGVISGQNVNDTDPTQVKVVTPSCTNLTATPNDGTASFESTLNCTASYANSYKIEIKKIISGEPIIKTINNNTGTYTFTTAGDYTASCYIDNKTTTPQACITNINVAPAPEPSISIDKTDANQDDRDGGASDTQTVYKNNKAVFRIIVTNNGNEDLKNVAITDKKAPSCNRTSAQTAALYTGSVFAIGDSFTYTCEKDNTTENYTNTAGVTAIGVGSNENVDDTDPTDIKIVEPVCTDLSIDKISGDVAFTSNFTCTGNNVDSYKILVKSSTGTVLQTINSNVGQYNFETAGTYSVECYMNDETETESVCKKTVTANEETNPSITIDKTDDNESLDTDDQVDNDTQTVINGNKAVFRITVTNNGTQDLKEVVLTDAIAPNCNKTAEETKDLYTGDVFAVGDHFTYTCEKDNTTQDYTNSATVNAKSTKDDTPVDAADTTEVKTGVYDLALIKEVVNPKTSYKKDEIIEFNIAVKNQGTIDATDVIISDYIPEGLELSDVSWTQTGTTATRNIGDIVAGNTKTVTITFKITTTSGDITNWAEISSTGDNLTDCDSTPDSNKDNDAYTTDFDSDNLNPEGCNKDDGDEDDHDPATITVLDQKFDLALRKTITSTGSYFVGSEVEYKIEVINQGDLTATGIVVTDYIPTNMELVSGNGWSAMDATTRETTKTVTTIAPGGSEELIIKLKILTGATGTINNYAEISEDNGNDCDSTADSDNTNDGTIIDDNIGGRCDNTTDDEDDHDIAPITVLEKEFDLALRKTVTSTGSYSVGSEVEYKIEVINQGDLTATGIVVTDYIPTNMELVSGNGWSAMDATTRETTKTVTTIAPGGSEELTIKLVISAGATGTINNYAEISADNGDDCDSTADSDNKNTAGEKDDKLVDDSIGGRCDDGTGDEDDHDIASITVGTPTPAIKIEKFSANNGTGSTDLDGVKEGGEGVNESQTLNTNVVAKFKIVVTNIGNEDLKDVKVTDILDGTEYTTCNKTIGDLVIGAVVEYTCDGVPTTKSYVNLARVEAKGKTSETSVTSENSTSVVLYTSGGGGGSTSHGGGGTAKCYDITVSGNTVTCGGNSKAKSFAVICDTVTDGKDLSKTVGEYKIGNSGSATFNCTTINEPKCFVYGGKVSNYGGKAWISNNQCTSKTDETGHTPAPRCGDLKVNQTSEQCDGGINCTSECKLKKDKPTLPPTATEKEKCENSFKYYNSHPECVGISTKPSGGEIWIYPVGNTLVGGNSVFEFDGVENTVNNNGGYYAVVSIVNIGTEPVNLGTDKFCIYNTGDKKILSGLGNDAELCEGNTIGWIYPGQTITFKKDASGIKGIPTAVSGDSETTTLVATLENFQDAFFAAKMNVTVAKSSVASQGGGTTYVKNGSSISSIKVVANNVSKSNGTLNRTINSNQNNFIATVLGDGTDLSEVDTLSGSIKDKAEDEAIELEENSKKVVEEKTFVGTKDEITTLDDFVSYKGIENVVSVRDTNVTLGAQNLTESKTYIIENGNLTIEGNIESNKNIAFIVKNGDIIIKDTVTRLDGTYVNIGGNIISDNTSNKLTVNGTIYGNTEDLFKNRTYVSMDKKGNISVGTLVNYGSNILNKPAPLVGQFIGEYMNSEKVAQ